MNAKKIAIIIGVVLLVLGSCFGFYKLFNFEKNNKETNTNIDKIGESTIKKLYSYLLNDNALEYDGVHSTHYVINTNLANQNTRYIQAMIYQYILNYDNFSLEVLTKEELSEVLNNTNNSTPLYKVSLSKFKKAAKTILGPDIKFISTDFDYNKNIKAKYNNEYYYIYGTNENINNNYIEYKEIIRYALTENNTVIKIYDYYLKCDLETKQCYNDENRKDLNTAIVYSSNFNIDNYINNLVTYEHSFKYDKETDSFYYYSSTVVN